MNASNRSAGSVFLSNGVPSFPHSAVLLQWLLLVGRPAWLVSSCLNSRISAGTIGINLKGWAGGWTLLLTRFSSSEKDVII